MPQEILYLSSSDVEHVIPSMAEIMQMLEGVFEQQATGKTQMPPKPGIFASDAESWRAMLAYVPALNAAGIKWVSVFGRNAEYGLPQISALIIVNDTKTGFPRAVLDGSWITAKRTAAASALAGRHLALPTARNLGVIGCGVQARSHVEAFLVDFPITDVFAYDVNQRAQEQYVREMSSRYAEVKFHPVTTAREAVEARDIVLSGAPILKTPVHTLRKEWLSPGSFVVSIDYVSHFHPDAFEAFDLICTDDQGQFEHYRSLGFFSEIPPFQCDLGQLVTGVHPGRSSDEELILACLLGVAVEDIAVAARVVDAAETSGVGRKLPL